MDCLEECLHLRKDFVRFFNENIAYVNVFTEKKRHQFLCVYLKLYYLMYKNENL